MQQATAPIRAVMRYNLQVTQAYGSTKEGLLFALEAKTGKIIWKHKIGNSLINTVVPLNGREVLFTATSGEVGLIRMKK